MKFKEIPQFPHSSYNVHVSLDFLKEHLDHWDERIVGNNHYLEMNPTWQRGHVWNVNQKIAFMEYFLMGGKTGKDVYFNCSTWGGDYTTPIYCLDGLQRISAALEFMDNKFPVFGCYREDYSDKPNHVHFNFNVLALKNKKELLKVYLDFNSGGTPHNPAELARIEKMIEKTNPDETL